MWSKFQPLPQDFIIPDDYVLPTEHFLNQVINLIQNDEQSFIVISGKPGVGKSTFASYLHNDLEERKVPVIRHHYFLSQRDDMASTRLDHLKAIESLMHDIKNNYKEALGISGGRNPTANELRSWLETCGSFYEEKNKKFIIIIDGLDHVWREKESKDELRSLFEKLLPLPQGVKIIVFTQPVSDEKLPNNFLQGAPRSNWLSMPYLNENAVDQWLRHQSENMFSYPKDQMSNYFYEQLSQAFYHKSNGHPLYLKYSLQYIKDQSLIITSDNVNNLPDCPFGEIDDIIW